MIKLGFLAYCLIYCIYFIVQQITQLVFYGPGNIWDLIKVNAQFLDKVYFATLFLIPIKRHFEYSFDLISM